MRLFWAVRMQRVHTLSRWDFPSMVSFARWMFGKNQRLVWRLEWLTIFPALASVRTALAFGFIGDGLRDALDPRARRR